MKDESKNQLSPQSSLKDLDEVSNDKSGSQVDFYGLNKRKEKEICKRVSHVIRIQTVVAN